MYVLVALTAFEHTCGDCFTLWILSLHSSLQGPLICFEIDFQDWCFFSSFGSNGDQSQLAARHGDLALANVIDILQTRIGKEKSRTTISISL